MSDRFVATSLTGWPITRHGSQSMSRRRPKVTWYVLDSAYCYRVVAAFDNYVGHDGQAEARHAARMLNLEDFYADARG